MTSRELPERLLVYGLGITNRAVVAASVRRGVVVTVLDDHPDPDKQAFLAAQGVESADSSTTLEECLAAVDAVVPTPGLAESHPLFAAAASLQVPMMSEFDLAAGWDDRPIISITGTNGKTTVTMLVTSMMQHSGQRAVAVGNTETPLISAIDDANIDVFVVEASSFRLAATQHFAPSVATWLNFAEDHLDVHATLDGYESAKARSWRDLTPTSTAVANLEDPVVARHVGEGAASFVTFGIAPVDAMPRTVVTAAGLPHFCVVDGWLTTPDGTGVVAVSELFRSLPHDISNALAATATALSGGATLDGVRTALREFVGLSHRVEFVAEAEGVRWYDDSKATAPHAVLAAVGGFESVVLIAGGRNKGLDLAVLAELAPRLSGLVGIGESGAEVLSAFSGSSLDDDRQVLASTMQAAVDAAGALARAGDVVVLSPGCASFDWYDNYGQRGDDFARLVRARLHLPAGRAMT